MLQKVNTVDYSDFIDLAKAHDCGCVYPLAIAEGIQEGDIFTSALNGRETVLFWAHSGFAYLSGETDEGCLDEIYGLMPDGNKPAAKRFLLMTGDSCIKEYFAKKSDVTIEKRYLFAYAGDRDGAALSLPSGCEMREIDDQLLKRISGQIVPPLFWKNTDAFLSKGKGYCIVCGNEAASWAFSAAVSTKEIDIGIETAAKYRQQGLGGIVAREMIAYAVRNAKRPVWACHSQNTASEKMAEKLGFVKTAECSVIKRKA